jgi:hypothetical protein
MDNFINYINTPATQSAGQIIFLLALALILGSSLLAFISELTHNAKAKAGYPVRCHNITRSTWIWVILFALVGGTIVFLPRAAIITQSISLTTAVLSAGIAVLLFLLYHFTTKLIKSKALHVPLALLAAAAAKIAATYWYLPTSFCAELDSHKSPLPSNELLSSWLQSGEMANFVHFILNAIAISALLFMLANAKEKEKKRRQPREYYFKASSFAGKWLFAAVTLQILPLGWLFYNFSSGAPNVLLSPPAVYWFAGMLVFALLGWLLLIKINKDGLVNRRATFIITLFFIISLCLLHFGPLKTAMAKPAAAAPSSTRTPEIRETQTPQAEPEKPQTMPRVTTEKPQSPQPSAPEKIDTEAEKSKPEAEPPKK